MKKSNKKKLYIVVIALIALFFELEEDIYGKLKTSLLNTKEDNEISELVIEDSSNLVVYFLDVGEADSILLSQNGKYALIDAGNNEDGERLVEYFKELGIEKFEYVIGTHAHEDHIGGMDDIVNNFDIGTFFMPDVITTTKTFEDLLDTLDQKSLYFDTPNIDDSFNLSDCNIEVIYVGNDSSDLNSTSIILKLTYNDISFLFTGDTTSEVEKFILGKDIESTVLKVSHHGSKYSSIASFLSKVNPKYAVISVGKDNSYSHPNDVVIERLNKIKADIYRTDELGTIIFATDGENIKVYNVITDTNGS